VRKPTVCDIDLFYRSLRDKKLAASTIRQIRNILAGSLDQAVRWGRRNDNPAGGPIGWEPAEGGVATTPAHRWPIAELRISATSAVREPSRRRSQ
jgi:hypothetical protein